MNLVEKALLSHLQRRHKAETKPSEEKINIKEEENVMKTEIKPQVKRVKIEKGFMYKNHVKANDPLIYYEDNFKPKFHFIKIKLKRCETGNWTIACK